LYSALLSIVALGALAFRLPKLAERPMHADEAVQTARFRELWQDGGYRYRPEEFHGPTLSYATLPAAWIAAPADYAHTTVVMYRIVPVLFGVGLVLLLCFFGDGLGWPAVICAGVLTAISPATVFFSRYYIHETLLVFFTTATITAGWRYARNGRLGWCLAAGAGLGLMQATKETAAIVYLAMAGALGLTWLAARLGRKQPKPPRTAIPIWHLALAGATALSVAVVFYSSFFTNAAGPLDAVRTYLPWLQRAGGESPHVHPWFYYLRILTFWRVDNGPLWSEGLVLLLAIVGLAAGFTSRTLPSAASPALIRWLGGYALLLTVLYSAIPYKTPWCLLGFLHAMILLAGVGAITLVRVTPTVWLKIPVTLALLAGVGHLGWQSHRAAYVLEASPQNPYVYAHTLPDVLHLVDVIEQLADASPDGREVPVQVVWSDAYYWPLPWHLRGLENVGYWQRVPSDLTAPIVIASPKHDEALTERLQSTHLMTDNYGLRPNVFVQLWVREDFWLAYLRSIGRI